MPLSHSFSPEEIEHFRHAFNVFDIDGNGSIDQDELKQIMQNLGRAVSEGEVIRMIASVDKEGTGVISFESFLLLMWKNRVERQALERYREAFRLLNTGATGFMVAQELRYALSCIGKRVADEELDEMMWQADVDGDGKLSYDEFVQIAQKVMYNEVQDKRGWETDLSTPTMQLWKEFIEQLPVILQQGGMTQKCMRPNRPMRTIAPADPRKRNITSDVKNLQTFLSQCRSGDIITVSPGTYVVDALVLNTDNVTFTGELDESTRPSDKSLVPAWLEAQRAQVILEGTSKIATLVIQTRFCKVENMTIRCSGAGTAIAVEQGYPDFSNIDVRGVHGGLVIKNRSFPSVCDSTFHDSAKAFGLSLRESRAVIERCKFFGNYDAGVLVERSSNPWIDDCTFVDGRGCGLVFLENSTGTVSHCNISQNACPGILIEGGANPIIWSNDVRRGKVTGIKVSSKGRGTISENRFENNMDTDIVVSDGANPSIQKNEFLAGTSVGIKVFEKGSALIDGNKFLDYGMYCVHVSNSPQVVVQHNNIKAENPEGRTGIFVGDNVVGRVADNKIIGWVPGFHQGGAPLHLGPHSADMQVTNNVIRKTDVEAQTENIVNLFGGGMARRRTLK
eukprot:PhM_4_TR8724/c0_g1_i1/m.70071